MAVLPCDSILLAGYGAGAGGVAYVGGFGEAYYSPAFVFPKQLGPDYAK